MLAKGLVIAFVGMVGTLLTLWMLTLIVEGLKRLFPYREEEETNDKERY